MHTKEPLKAVVGMKRLPLLCFLLLAGCAGAQQGAGGSVGSDASAQLRVAAAAERSGQMDIALSLYASAAEAYPGNADVAERYAAALLSVGEPAQARAALAEARRRNPSNRTLAQLEGRVLLETGAPAQALAIFDTLLAGAPTDTTALNGRGVALDMLGRHAEARPAYLAARSADPSSPLWAGNLALSLMLSGCPETAVALLGNAPRTAATTDWINRLQSMARGLAAGTDTSLSNALPRGSEPCPNLS
jgi:Flp pilus assembly protein TadD